MAFLGRRKKKKANRKVKPFIKTTPPCVVFYILKNLKTLKATQISNSKLDIFYIKIIIT